MEKLQRTLFVFILLLLACSFGSASEKEPRRNIRTSSIKSRMNVTFEEYQEIVKAGVARLIDVQPAFDVEETFLGGGVLIGLLHRLDTEIIKSELEGKKFRLAAISIPPISTLVAPTDDNDLWTKDSFTLRQLERKGFKTSTGDTGLFSSGPVWDILTHDKYEESVGAGGAGLEKLQVSPTHINDPYGSLREYYEGKISFHLVSKDRFDQNTKGWLSGLTQTAQALRFLRLAIKNPHLTITSESWKSLKKIAKQERDLPDCKKWIPKALKKLFHAQLNPNQALTLLAEANLLPNLVKAGFTINHPLVKSNIGIVWWTHFDSILSLREPLQKRILKLKMLGMKDDELSSYLRTVPSNQETKRALEKCSSLIKN